MHHNLQKTIFHDPWRRHTYSDSKMVVLHSFCLLPILVNKKICLAYKSLTADHNELSSFILPPDTHHKLAKSKEKYQTFSIALKFHLVKDETIPSSKSRTKITFQAHHIHEHWQYIWPSNCRCLFHEYSTWRTWTQISRPCDILLPWLRGNSPSIPPQSSSEQAWIFLL